MECKYSPQVQAEINEIKKFIENYHNLFSLKIEYYIDNFFKRNKSVSSIDSNIQIFSFRSFFN